uniref:Uncharacterized protein n=1 Tax=Arundo donax TaxID=35708 RepID=A0A0A9FWI0_ARUDO
MREIKKERVLISERKNRNQ